MILITGIAGFIGSATARRLLKSGHKVIGIDNFNNFYDPKIKYSRAEKLKELGAIIIEGDISNIDKLLQDYSITQVLHIAASAGVRPSIDNPLGFYKNNVENTLIILEYMKKKNIKNIVFASSSSVYGNIIKRVDEGAIKEDDIKEDIYSPYAATKLSCEKLLSTYSNLYNINAISLRYFTVYGPDQRPDLAIIKFIRNGLNDKSIDVYGDGNSFRDYTYIDDVVKANLLALKYIKDNVGHKILNISSNSPINLSNLIHKIEIGIGKTISKNTMGNQLGDVVGTFGDNKKAFELLNWTPTTKIETGILNTIIWYKNNY